MLLVPDGLMYRTRMLVLSLLFLFPGSVAFVHTEHVFKGLVRQLTRGIPSLVPVPINTISELSSDDDTKASPFAESTGLKASLKNLVERRPRRISRDETLVATEKRCLVVPEGIETGQGTMRRAECS
jgi:hypothetical protein